MMRTSYGVPLVADSAFSHHLGLSLILWLGGYLLVCPFFIPMCFFFVCFFINIWLFIIFVVIISTPPSTLKISYCTVCTKKHQACIHTTAYLLGNKGIPRVTFREEMNEHTHEERMPLRYCLDTENLSRSPSLIIVPLHFRDNKLPRSTPDEI